MKKKLIIGYVRVSTDEQNKRGFSLNEQIEMVTKYYNEHYSDDFDFRILNDGGYSATSLKRKGIVDLLKLIDKKVVHAIVYSSNDRLARNTIDMLSLVQIFNINNIHVKSLYGDVKFDTAVDILNLTVASAINQFESARIGERTKIGLDGKAKSGFYPCSSLPFGISRCKETGKLYHNENIEIVKKLFELYTNVDLSLAEIKEKIVALYPDFNINIQRGYLTKLFKNTLYQGYYIRTMSDGTKMSFNVIEPIFSEREILSINSIRPKHKLKNIHKYALINKVYLSDNTRLCVCKQRKKLSDGSTREYNYYYSLKHKIYINEDVLITKLKNAIKKNKCAAKKAYESKISDLDELLLDGTISKEKYKYMVSQIKKKENLQLKFKRIIVDFDKTITVIF